MMEFKNYLKFSLIFFLTFDLANNVVEAKNPQNFGDSSVSFQKQTPKKDKSGVLNWIKANKLKATGIAILGVATVTTAGAIGYKLGSGKWPFQSKQNINPKPYLETPSQTILELTRQIKEMTRDQLITSYNGLPKRLKETYDLDSFLDLPAEGKATLLNLIERKEKILLSQGHALSDFSISFDLSSDRER